MTSLNVQSASVSLQRSDIRVSFATPTVNPDSEYRQLSFAAERIWADPRLRIQSETIAIVAAHASQPSGAFERNTYFYYRSERPMGKPR